MWSGGHEQKGRKPTEQLQLAPEGRETGRTPLPEILPSWRISLVARATKMIPSSSSFSVSELSLSSSSSDSTVNVTAAGQGHKMNRGGRPSAASCYCPTPNQLPVRPGRALVGRATCFLLWLLQYWPGSWGLEKKGSGATDPKEATRASRVLRKP